MICKEDPLSVLAERGERRPLAYMTAEPQEGGESVPQKIQNVNFGYICARIPEHFLLTCSKLIN
jgi:hypothetical protein